MLILLHEVINDKLNIIDTSGQLMLNPNLLSEPWSDLSMVMIQVLIHSKVQRASCIPSLLSIIHIISHPKL